jgi:hypothetical protein
MGIIRLLVAGLVVLSLLVLLFVGVRALVSSLSTKDAAQPAASTPAVQPPVVPQQSAGTSPTLFIECEADRCPVFVRVSAGDVLIDRDLTRGEQASYFDDKLDVVLGDAGTVRVLENGRPRPPGKDGERQTFVVTRAQAQ